MEPEQKSNSALIGIIIIIIILLIGGIYFWKNSRTKEPENPSVSDTAGSSAADLDANVNNIDLDNLDSGI